ncbi:hypothetical protein BJX70DRAFT_334415 [Aspergillus crustosus]
MARGILGKSRSPPQAQGISQPVLKYTDALPRNDLREIEPGRSYSRPIHQHQVIKAEQQSAATSEKRNVRRKTETPAPGFDFQITAPEHEDAHPVDPRLNVDEFMIGIALGSPRLLEPQSKAAQRIPPPTPPDERPSSALQRKSSKWRKIGGLFKAKRAIAPLPNKPFYQVRAETEGPSQGSTHSIDYKSRRRAGTKTEPIENTEVWPCLVSEGEAIARQQELKLKMPGTLLQVEIPTVEMERYSVMFGGLLNNSRPSLLNRRSKTLDDVTIPGKEDPPLMPLMPPQRRATSPSRSRSPNFTLFPTMQSSKASKVLGTQNIPQVPDSLRRSQTPLGGPLQDRLSIDQGNSTLKTQPSHRPQASVTSFLSSTSIGSDDEPLLIQKIERVRTFAGMEEPDWEIINRRAPPPPAIPAPPPPAQSNKATPVPVAVAAPEQPPRNLKIVTTTTTRELPSDSNSTTSTTATATTALSSSRSSSPILSPLRATTIEPHTDIPELQINLKPKPLFPKRTVSMKPPPATDATQPTMPQPPIPTIEVSIARSVSVSKGKRQMIVPVRTKTGPSHHHPQHHHHSHLDANERLVERSRQARTPMVRGGDLGHRPGVSQDVRIEMA